MPRPAWAADYETVRNAGWTFDHDRRCWYHATGRVWAAANQSEILRHLRAGTEVPTRPEPPIRTQREARAEVIASAIEADARNGVAATDFIARRVERVLPNWNRPQVHSGDAGLRIEMAWTSGQFLSENLPRVTRQKANSKVAADWRPNVWEA